MCPVDLMVFGSVLVLLAVVGVFVVAWGVGWHDRGPSARRAACRVAAPMMPHDDEETLDR
jgi:hypothetical protein